MATKSFSIPVTNYSKFGNRSNTTKAPGTNGITWVKIKNKKTVPIVINIFAGATPSFDTYLYLYRSTGTSYFASNDDSGGDGESLINNITLAAGETIYAWCTPYSAKTSSFNGTADFEVRNLRSVDDVSILKYDELEFMRAEPTITLNSVGNKIAKLNIQDNSYGYDLNYNVFVSCSNQPKTLIHSFSSNQPTNKTIFAGVGLTNPFLQSNTEYSFTLESSGPISTELKTSTITFSTKDEQYNIQENTILEIDNNSLFPVISFLFDLNDKNNLLKENVFELKNKQTNEVINLGNIIFTPNDSFTNKNVTELNVFPLKFSGNLVVENIDNVLHIKSVIDYNTEYTLTRTIRDIKFQSSENDVISDFALLNEVVEYNIPALKEIKIENIVKNKTSKTLQIEIKPTVENEQLPQNYKMFFETKINEKTLGTQENRIFEKILQSNSDNKIECYLKFGTSLENCITIDNLFFIENMPKLNKPNLTVENKKSYANLLNFDISFGTKKEPNLLFDIYRSEVNKKSGEPLEFSEFSYCNKDPNDDQFILRHFNDGFMLDPKKIIKDAENNIYLCLHMFLGFYSQEDEKWHSIYAVDDYYGNKIVCIMLNNSKDTLYFSTRSLFLKYDTINKVVTTIYDLSNCINLPNDVYNYQTHNIIETTNGIYFIFNNKIMYSYYNTTIYKLYNDSLVFIREIPNTGIIRNCYFDLEFQEIRLMCDRKAYYGNDYLFNNSVIFFLDEFCNVKTKTCTYDNLKDEEKFYNCRIFFDKENNVLYNYLFKERYDGEKYVCSNKLFEYNNSKNLFEEKHTEFLSKLNNNFAIKMIQNGIVIHSANSNIGDGKIFIRSLDGSINKEITMYDLKDTNSPYYKSSGSGRQATAFYSFDDMVLFFAGGYTEYCPEPNEIVFEKYIINKEEVGEELLIARNVSSNSFLDKKCKSGKTYKYRVNAKDKDTL